MAFFFLSLFFFFSFPPKLKRAIKQIGLCFSRMEGWFCPNRTDHCPHSTDCRHWNQSFIYRVQGACSQSPIRSAWCKLPPYHLHERSCVWETNRKENIWPAFKGVIANVFAAEWWRVAQGVLFNTSYLPTMSKGLRTITSAVLVVRVLIRCSVSYWTTPYCIKLHLGDSLQEEKKKNSI